ncbi:MAG: endonuclease III [Thermoplasmatota archaeon]
MSHRGPEILEALRREYPGVRGTELNHRTPLELLVATILSAQTTDKQVNKITPALFKKYPNVEAYADADPEELQEAISSVNFYRNKARYIQQSAQIILDTYHGKVPDSMEELVKLPGVSRKTANVVLSNIYGREEGVVVDTHVMRLSQRLGLTDHKNRDKIERDLMARFPREEWFALSNLLIAHGRQVCHARNPQCQHCVLRKHCPHYARVVQEDKGA